MLEIRVSCENCGKNLPPNSEQAYICSYECTFCLDCVMNILKNVCPNCGGSFEKRPIRPAKQLAKHPPREDPVLKPVDMESFIALRDTHEKIAPKNR